MFPLPRETDEALDDNKINAHVRNEVSWSSLPLAPVRVHIDPSARVPASPMTYISLVRCPVALFSVPCDWVLVQVLLNLFIILLYSAWCIQVVGPEWGSEETSAPNKIEGADDNRSLVFQADFEGHMGELLW